MAGPTPVAPTSSSADSAIQQMTEAFNQAIAQSAKVTAITTEKKAELDAAQQRPQSA
jgi:hypothetical protein